jgi:hypothetical protein
MKKPATNLIIPLPMLLWLAAGQSPAANEEDVLSLPMKGTEIIDPKERISGGALVGINFLDTKTKFDPNAVFVSFDIEPCGVIKTQLTTVDGRYIFTAQNGPENRPNLTIKPVKVDLEHTDRDDKDGRPLNAKFLDDNYNKLREDREIAVLVTDEKDRAFPVRWGPGGSTSTLRIRVNAEGADAYFITYENKNDGEDDKPHLEKCDEASENSQFKFDHICDMRWQDVEDIVKKGGEVQIIRKRGATYESPIPIKVAIPESGPESGSENCVDRI